ncbi:membrane protein [Gordonia Phage JonJames]|nr:membrane protein [Gordonia Phage JonJames]
MTRSKARILGILGYPALVVLLTWLAMETFYEWYPDTDGVSVMVFIIGSIITLALLLAWTGVLVLAFAGVWVAVQWLVDWYDDLPE